MNWRWDILVGYGPLFAQGLWMTLQLTLISTSAGLVLGALVGLINTNALIPRNSAWHRKAALTLLRWIAKGYVTFFRGTPLFVQILLIHFAVMPVLVHPDGGWLLSGDLARDFRQEQLGLDAERRRLYFRNFPGRHSKHSQRTKRRRLEPGHDAVAEHALHRFPAGLSPHGSGTGQ